MYIGEGQSFGNHGNTGEAHAKPSRPIGYVPIEYREISRQVHAVMRTGYWTSFLWRCFGVPNSLDIVMEVLRTMDQYHHHSSLECIMCRWKYTGHADGEHTHYNQKLTIKLNN